MSADFTIRIHASEPLLEVLRGVATSLTDLARAIGGPRAAARPREEEPFEIRPDPPSREIGLAKNSPAGASAPADDGGGADDMPSSSLCRVTGVSSQTPPGALLPPAAFSAQDAGKKWSRERCAALASLRAMKVTFEDTLAELNKLPGPKIASANAVNVQFRKLQGTGRLPVVVVAAPPVQSKFTAQRIELLRVMRADGKRDSEIREALNDLPGEKLGVYAIRDFLRQPKNSGKFPFGLPRQEIVAEAKVIAERSRGGEAAPGVSAAPARPAMTPADVVARREAAPVVVKTPLGAAVKHQVSEMRLPPEPVSVDYEQARSWAAQRGLVSVHEQLDMDRVNAKRRELSLGIFVAREKADSHRFVRRADA